MNQGQIRRKKEKLIFRKLRKRNSRIFKTGLVMIFKGGLKGDLLKQTTAREILRKHYRADYADTAILRQLTGNGYLRIDGDSYMLTRKGAELIALPPQNKPPREGA